MKYTSRWEMPEVWFYQVEGHGFAADEGRPLYAYGKPGDTDDNGIPKTGELYAALDRALVAWVAEKYTGPRGAGGSGVGTAADWFMRMIGADDLVAVDHQAGQKALTEALASTSVAHTIGGPLYRRAQAVSAELDKRGLVIARMNHGN
jgi:hypothetical protein